MSSSSLVNLVKGANTRGYKTEPFNMNKEQIREIVDNIYFKPKKNISEEQYKLMKQQMNDLEKIVADRDLAETADEIKSLIHGLKNDLLETTKSPDDINQRFNEMEIYFKENNSNVDLQNQIDGKMNEMKEMIEQLQQENVRKIEYISESREKIDNAPEIKTKTKSNGWGTILIALVVFLGIFGIYDQNLNNGQVTSNFIEAIKNINPKEDNKNDTEVTNDIDESITAEKNDSVESVLVDNTGMIKGNINENGEKIYHLPGGEYYDKTIITPETGEQYFETEEEAIAAGFRAAIGPNEMDYSKPDEIKNTNSNLENKNNESIESTNFSSEEDSLSSIKEKSSGNVTVTATVIDFNYDPQSGTKFLILSDGFTEIDAIIFSNTKVPYINEQDVYTISGYMQESPYNDSNEIVVESIDK